MPRLVEGQKHSHRYVAERLKLAVSGIGHKPHTHRVAPLVRKVHTISFGASITRCRVLLGMFRWATVACVLWLLTPPSLQAQYPRARRGQFEVSGWDFRREGAWRRRVSAIRSLRHELLRSRSFSSLNLAAPTAAGGQRVTGRVIVPVIPIAFSN